MVPVKRNQTLTLDIVALNSQGQGIGRYENYAIFVPGALPGENVEIVVIKDGSKFGIGKLLKINIQSQHRVTPICTAFNKCGGCALLHLNYAEQLVFKHRQVYDALKRIGGFDVRVLPTIGMDEPYAYRNKAAFANSEEGFGFFSEHSHRVVALENCNIVSPVSVQIMQVVQSWARKFSIPAYNEQNGSGILRHVVSRICDGKAMAIIVVKTQPTNLSELIERIKEIDCVESIILNINPQLTNVIMGTKNTVLFGKEKLTQSLLGMQFEVGAESFLQVNNIQTEKLYNTALSYAQLCGNETVVDVYCGVGTISLLAAKYAKKVIGVEIVQTAVMDAKRNAELNNIGNAEFICAPAEQKLRDIVAKEQIDVIFLDPPRKGCEQEVLTAAAKAKPKRIIYVSCNPATLARDCKILGEHGYEVESVQPVDMFAHTAHVETIVLLQRKKLVEILRCG